MKPYRHSGTFVTIHTFSLVKGITVLFFILLLLFSLSGVITKLNNELGLSSLNINKATSFVDMKTIYALMGTENRYFLEGLPKEEQKLSIVEPIFSMATSIQIDQPKTFLESILPGLYAYNPSGVSKDTSEMPIESTPPNSALEKDAPVKNTDEIEPKETNQDAPAPPQTQSTGDKEVVYLFFTHNRESFLPYLEGVTDPDLAQHSEINVTKIGDRLLEELEQKGIGAQVEETDIIGNMVQNGIDYLEAYDASRPVVQEAMANNRDIAYLIDIHRDSKPREDTTIEINGKTYAKLVFVVGKENPNYKKNLALAEKINGKLQEKYPGIIGNKGKVIVKHGPGTDGVFNQDLHGSALLVEFGGVGNRFEELYNSTEAFANVFSEYYWQAEMVNGGENNTSEQ